MSLFPSQPSLHLRPRLRHWPAIGALLAAAMFLLAWSEAAIQVAHGAARIQITAPVAMSFGAGGLYLALALGLVVSLTGGALAGGAAALVAIMPSRGRPAE